MTASSLVIQRRRAWVELTGMRSVAWEMLNVKDLIVLTSVLNAGESLSGLEPVVI